MSGPDRLRRFGAVVFVACALVGGAVAVDAAPIGPTSDGLAATVSTPPVFYVRLTTTANRAGGIVGRVEGNDRFTVRFPIAVLQSTVCSAWTTQSNNRSLAGITFTLDDNAGITGNDLLTVTGSPATCAAGFHIGSMDLGSANYVSGGDKSFANSSLALSSGTGQALFTFTLGTTVSGPGTVATVASGAFARFDPDAVLSDTAAHLIGLNKAQTTTTVQF